MTTTRRGSTAPTAAAGGALRGATLSRFCALLLAALIIALATSFGAAAQSDDGRIAEIEKRLDFMDTTALSVDARLNEDNVDPDALDRLRETMSEQRAEARSIVEELSAVATPLREQLEALGPAPEEGASEPADVAERRAALAERVQTAEGRVRRADLAAKRANSLVEALATRRRAALTRQLLAHGPTAFEFDTWTNAIVEWPDLAARFIEGVVAIVYGTGVVAAVAFTAALAALAFYLYGHGGSPIPRLIRFILDGIRATTSPSTQILLGFAVFAARVGPLAAVMLIFDYGLKEFVELTPIGADLLDRLTEGVLIVLVVSAAARIVFAPTAPRQRIYDLGEHASRAWVMVVGLCAVICAGRVVLLTAEDAGATPAALTVANFVVVALAAPLVFDLARLLCAPSATARSDAASSDEDEDAGVGPALARFGRYAGVLVAIVAPASAALGYYALSRFVLERSALTAVLLLALIIAYAIIKRLLEGPIAPAEENDVSVSSDLGAMAPPRRRAVMGLAPAMAGSLLFLVGAPLFAMIWGASAADIRVLAVDLLDGVEIGGATYSVVDVLGAVAVFIVGLWITRFLQRVLSRTVLPNTSLDTGAKTSLAAGLGYVGFFITALLAISAAGLDLSNLAIVAGALSVGIGFGLQNIVNNFVSGLILLVERPVKVGDWIVVGAQQGYVRRINVRATEIETFDRSSVIVPNSELISNSVLNWTHKNLVGRLIVRVGVSYDADPERVAAILKEIGEQHPMVLRFPAPFVYFAGFGDSALNFELRLMLRDVNYSLSTHHDVNMAIYRRFKEEGVEIPFPQRDLNLRLRSGVLEDPSAINGRVSDDPAERPAETGVRTREVELDADPDIR